MPHPNVVRVALPVPVDTLFSYAVPPALAAGARPGVRVLVPFGARRMAGLVVASGAGEDARQLADDPPRIGRQAIADDPHLRNGLNVHEGLLTCRPVAEAQGLTFTPPDKVI